MPDFNGRDPSEVVDALLSPRLGILFVLADYLAYVKEHAPLETENVNRIGEYLALMGHDYPDVVARMREVEREASDRVERAEKSLAALTLLCEDVMAVFGALTSQLYDQTDVSEEAAAARWVVGRATFYARLLPETLTHTPYMEEVRARRARMEEFQRQAAVDVQQRGAAEADAPGHAGEA